MPDEKAPSSGAFLPSSLMHHLSGEPMYDLSGVDTPPPDLSQLFGNGTLGRPASNPEAGGRPARATLATTLTLALIDGIRRSASQVSDLIDFDGVTRSCR